MKVNSLRTEAVSSDINPVDHFWDALKKQVWSMKDRIIPQHLDSHHLMLTPWCQKTQQNFRGCVKSGCREVRTDLAPKVGPIQCGECCGGLDVLALLHCQATTNHKGQHFLKYVLHSKNTLLITSPEKKLFCVHVPMQIQRMCPLSFLEIWDDLF